MIPCVFLIGTGNRVLSYNSLLYATNFEALHRRSLVLYDIDAEKLEVMGVIDEAVIHDFHAAMSTINGLVEEHSFLLYHHTEET